LGILAAQFGYNRWRLPRTSLTLLAVTGNISAIMSMSAELSSALATQSSLSEMNPGVKSPDSLYRVSIAQHQPSLRLQLIRNNPTLMKCRYRRPNRASLQDPRTVYHVVELISIG
jgi:hypothetical protein